MDFTNGFYKAENPVVLEEVKTFLQSMERRGATVKDLDDAIVQLNNVSHSIGTNALVKADVLDDLPDNPFRSMVNLNLIWLLIIVIAIFGFPDTK